MANSSAWLGGDADAPRRMPQGPVPGEREPLRRREVLAAGGLLAALVAMPGVVWEWPRISALLHAGERRREVLDRLADLLLPATDTPGAAATGVSDFVMLALRHGLDGTRTPSSSAAINGATTIGAGDGDDEPESSRRLLAPIHAALDDATGSDFLAAKPDAQLAAVTALDAAAFKPGNDDHPWHKIKDLILLGYYTSEVGGSKELRYELVPGRWDADIPLTPDMRAWSSDWTAVEFG